MSYPRKSQTPSILEDSNPVYKASLRGYEALTDIEILQIIIGNKEVARNLITTFGSIRSLVYTPISEIQKIKGIGKAIASKISAIGHMYTRLRSENMNRAKLNSAETVYKFLELELANEQVEHFVVLYLNRNNELISKKFLFKGGVNATVIDTRIIFKHAVDLLASSIILVHNHPSGNLNPSQPDKRITQKCKEAGKLFDIPVLDHVIISTKGYYSFANSGIL